MFCCSVNVVLAHVGFGADCTYKAIPTSMEEAVSIKQSWATLSHHQMHLHTAIKWTRICAGLLAPPDLPSSLAVSIPCDRLGTCSSREPQLSKRGSLV